jgi:hypothetical protein
MAERTPLPVKDAARQLCDELSHMGLQLPYMKALDICARLDGYIDWREHEREHAPVDTRAQTVRIVYLTGFSDKGYWWTQAEAEPWLVGRVDVDFAGPFETQELALEQARIRFPNALVVPHEAPTLEERGEGDWQSASVYLTMRVYCTPTPRVTRIMRNPNPDSEDARDMSDCLEFNPRYASPDGRILGVAYRSALKFVRFDTMRRCAAFEFSARLDISKPSGTSLKALVDRFSLTVRLSDNYEEPDTELLSWE